MVVHFLSESILSALTTKSPRQFGSVSLLTIHSPLTDFLFGGQASTHFSPSFSLFFGQAFESTIIINKN